MRYEHGCEVVSPLAFNLEVALLVTRPIGKVVVETFLRGSRDLLFFLTVLVGGIVELAASVFKLLSD